MDFFPTSDAPLKTAFPSETHHGNMGKGKKVGSGMWKKQRNFKRRGERTESVYQPEKRSEATNSKGKSIQSPGSCMWLLPGYQHSTTPILSCLVSLESRNKLKYPQVCQRPGSKTRSLYSKGKQRVFGIHHCRENSSLRALNPARAVPR